MAKTLNESLQMKYSAISMTICTLHETYKSFKNNPFLECLKVILKIAKYLEIDGPFAFLMVL